MLIAALALLADLIVRSQETGSDSARSRSSGRPTPTRAASRSTPRSSRTGWPRAGHDVRDRVSWSAQYPARLYPGAAGRRRAGGRALPGHDLPAGVAPPGRVGGCRPAAAPRTTWSSSCRRHPPSRSRRTWRCWRRPATGAARQAGCVLCHNVLPHERRPRRRAAGAALLRPRRRGPRALPRAGRAGRARCGAADVREVAAAAAPARRRAASSGPTVGRPAAGCCRSGMVRAVQGRRPAARALRAVPDLTLTVAGEFWGGPATGCGGWRRRPAWPTACELRAGYVPADRAGAAVRRADALALPYRTATASQNALLGFAHGLPVVATRVGTFAARRPRRRRRPAGRAGQRAVADRRALAAARARPARAPAGRGAPAGPAHPVAHLRRHAHGGRLVTRGRVDRRSRGSCSACSSSRPWSGRSRGAGPRSAPSCGRSRSARWCCRR